MPVVPLSRIATARSGDKGEGSNVGVMARSDLAWRFLRRELTGERVRQHMRAINHGQVKRYEAENMRLLNFILQDSLGGGGSASLKTDAQGKTHGQGLLTMEIDVPAELVPTEIQLAELQAADPAAGSPEAMKGE